MRRGLALVALILVVTCADGCSPFWHKPPDGRHRSDLVDFIFKQRHYDLRAKAECDPVMALARDLTEIEDDLRRDGTITVKQPDVWGNGNLMYFIQEYDQLIANRTKEFGETLQAYIARSDAAELQSATAIGMAVGRSAPTAPTAPSSNATVMNQNTANAQAPQATLPELINIPPITPFDLIRASTAAAPPVKKEIGVEPTELARQHSTYIDVCQALRRRHMGDDNSRAAGYGLYKFRVPVSVLPGRETSHGFAAVVTLRAQLQVDEANLRYTYPKLVIADLVDTLSPVILRDWRRKPETGTIEEQAYRALSDLRGARDLKFYGGPSAQVLDELDAKIKDQLTRLKSSSEDSRPAAVELAESVEQVRRELQPYAAATTTPIAPLSADVDEIYSSESLNALRSVAEQSLLIELDETGKPKMQELRSFLFRYLGQVHEVLDRNRLYSAEGGQIIRAAAEHVASGQYALLNTDRCSWLQLACPEVQENLRHVGWLLALQSGILDLNLKKILEEMLIKASLPHEAGGYLEDPNFCFFDLRDEVYAAARVQLWQTIIREEFPLHVFTLDPQVEEQNVYDAFSRRREMQLALAYNMARGRFNMAQKLAYSRQLALDQADIALNRTAVGFSHGEDTFGWYFYPRVQAPPTESTNIGAFARMLWSTGPTEHYDLKHRKLEPGMRECEVLIVMPSFVTEVRFDVTSNWEAVAHPGVTKRSYEEMLGQGRRMHETKLYLANLCTADRYRPGDVERLISRIDQLDQMLGMQTHEVSVPYEYEQSGTDLFSTGDVHLRPVLTGYYGLEYLQADPPANTAEAFLFLTGKNFHPTLSHVIVGGREADSLSTGTGSAAEVEVVSRELLRVKVPALNARLSRVDGFQVRVGTPAGLSGPLKIPPRPAAPTEQPKGWSFGNINSLLAAMHNTCCKDAGTLHFQGFPVDPIIIRHNLPGPLAGPMNGSFFGELTAARKDGTAIEFATGRKVIVTQRIPLIEFTPPNPSIPTEEWALHWDRFTAAVSNAMALDPPKVGNEPFVVTVAGYVAFDTYPISKMLNTIKIEVVPCACPCPKAEILEPAVPPGPGNQPPAVTPPENPQSRWRGGNGGVNAKRF